MLRLFRKFFDTTDKEIRRLSEKVAQINQLEPRMERLSDEELRGQTAQFKKRLAGGETLDDLLPEAFAAVREAAKRTIGQRHYDVQLMGGIVLHEGRIAEMKTGEGKTLAATLPVYLNALDGRGVHVVTVNDYLARRDAEWMGTSTASWGCPSASSSTASTSRSGAAGVRLRHHLRHQQRVRL